MRLLGLSRWGFICLACLSLDLDSMTKCFLNLQEVSIHILRQAGIPDSFQESFISTKNKLALIHNDIVLCFQHENMWLCPPLEEELVYCFSDVVWLGYILYFHSIFWVLKVTMTLDKHFHSITLVLLDPKPSVFIRWLPFLNRRPLTFFWSEAGISKSK